jgi:hypothetical protein
VIALHECLACGSPQVCEDKSVLNRRLCHVVALALVSFELAGCEAYRDWQYPCLSRETGLRGEAKRRADGQMLYFDGECWTARPMPPRDSPF